MKNLFKRLLSLITAILLLGIFPITSFAMSKSYLSREIIHTETLADGTVLKTINNSNLKKIQSKSLDGDYDEAKNIMQELGIKINENLESHKKVLECVNSARSISVISQYIKIDKNGMQTVLSEEECFKSMEIERDRVSVATKNLAYNGNEKVHENEFMRQSILVLYLGEVMGEYLIIGQHEWLMEPISRGMDAFSLYSKNLDWYHEGQNAYCKTEGYKNYEEEWYDSYEDPVINEEGVYYTTHLPIDINGNKFTDIWFQIIAKARVHDYDDLTQILSVGSKYAHSQIGIAIGCGWNSGSQPGVSLVGAIYEKDYYINFTWNYLEIFY